MYRHVIMDTQNVKWIHIDRYMSLLLAPHISADFTSSELPPSSSQVAPTHPHTSHQPLEVLRSYPQTFQYPAAQMGLNGPTPFIDYNKYRYVNEFTEFY